MLYRAEIIYYILTSIQLFGWLALGLVIQKIIFLESHTPQQRKSLLKYILFTSIGLAILDTLILTHVCDDILRRLFGFYVGVVMVYITITYSAYTGRKKRKWLAFFEILPIIGCIDGVWEVIDALKRRFPNVLYQDIFEFAVILLLLGIIGLTIWKKPRAVTILIRDIRTRALTVREEIVVWIVGVWLALYNVGIDDIITANTTPSIVGYISMLNFIVGGIVFAYVINSNYRYYYFKKTMQLQMSLITTVAELIENRDANTGGHIQRTSRYVEIIARQLKREGKFANILTKKYIEDMVIAAPLHDVGKIHIPDAILNKPGKLDPDEFDTMKTHAAAGGEIIAHIERNTGAMEYLKIAKEMDEYHHERMDGKGYPHGLMGEDIPLCARILAVADVFDAVSSKRCYKEAFSLDKSFSIIEEEAGSHFDKDVAKAFLDCRAEVERLVIG